MATKEIDYSQPYSASPFTMQFMAFREAMLSPKSNKTPMFHYALVDSLTGENKEQVVESFRGSAKSTTVTCDMPLYLAFFGKADWFNGQINYAMIVSETSTQAQDLIREIRNTYDESEALQAAMELTIARADELEFTIGERKFSLVAKGAGQSMRGIKRRGQRPQVFLVDDLEDDEAVMNKESRRKLKNWFFKVLKPARDPNNYKIFFVGTPLHDDSLLANLMADSDWCPVKFPIQDEDGNPAWSDRFSKEWIDKEMASFRKQGMGKAFFQEYMLQVIDDDDAVFKKDNFTYYNDGDMQKFLPQMNVFTSVDLAISKEDYADYTVVTTIAVNSDNHWFILNQDVSKSSLSETINILFGQIGKYRPQLLILETVAYQLAFKTEVENEMMRRNSFVRIETTKRMKKELKIQTLQPRYNVQSVHHPKGDMSWVKDLEEQLTMFRPEGALTKHDDQIDCMTGNTLIHMADGTRKRLDLLEEDEEVMTIGIDSLTMSAKDVRMTGVKEVSTYILTDGTKLDMTDNHPVMTQRGYVFAGDLLSTDYLIKAEVCNLKNMEENGLEVKKDTINQQHSLMGREDGCINTLGVCLTESKKKAMKFIISTTTKTTMIFQTLSVSLSQSIQHIMVITRIRKILLSTLIGLEGSLKSGIPQEMVSNGTTNIMRRTKIRFTRRFSEIAMSAIKKLLQLEKKQECSALGFALTDSDVAVENLIKNLLANGVKKHSLHGTQEESVVLKSVQKVAVYKILDRRKEKTYNLEIAGTHNYLVNGGFVVHNCLSMLTEYAYAPSDMSENSREYLGADIEEYKNPYF